MINRVVLMGRLVADPELKTTGSGVSVTSFRIAVDRNYVKQGAERQADFIDIVAWRGTAEFVCKHFNKGSLVAIDGQLQSRQYQTKDGQNRTAIEVVADNVSFTGERRDDPQPVQPTYQENRSSRPAYNRQQTLAETQQGQPSDYRYSRERQREQREAQQGIPDSYRYGGGRPSDGGYGPGDICDQDLDFV